MKAMLGRFGLGCLLLMGCTHPAAGPSQSAASTRSAAAVVRYVDVSQQAGIRFKHFNGAAGHRYLPETMGAGGAFLDYDGDGWDDVLLLNGKPLTSTGQGRTVAAPTAALYHNNRNGTFTDVTRGSGLDTPLYAMGCAVGDYDNDGRDDVYVTCAIGSSRLFHNDGGGKFRDVTVPAGVTDDGRMGTSCAWLDYDRDGWLDLFVCNYVQYSLAADHSCYEAGRRYYCRPNVYKPDTCLLYRNRGDGTFDNVTKSTGVWNQTGNSLGVSVWDLDGDGWPDVVVANDLTPNYVFHNVPRHRAQTRGFEEVGLDWGIAVGEDARARAGMGIDVAEYRNDRRPAIAISNFTGEPLSFFVRDGPRQFSDVAFQVGLGEAHLRFLGFGLFFFDYDNDGNKDIFVGNGHIEPNIAQFGEGVSYGERNQLFRNRGDGSFDEVGQQLGAPFRYERVTRGAAYGDFDNDGELDILVANNGQPAELLRNDGGNHRNWLQVELRGKGPGGKSGGSNRDGIGALVTARAGSLTQRDYVSSGSSYCSQSMLRRHFGLGSSGVVDELEVRWPSGIVDRLRDVKANQRIIIDEGQGLRQR
jgi:hypothetical protein